MIEHIFLDFDGTIMVYDEEPGFFHPQVIEMLNALPKYGVKWYSNSGRGFGAQQQILAASIQRGLHNMPEALLCSECFIFTRHSEEFLPLEPWNSNARELLTAYHSLIQETIQPHLDDWKQYVPNGEIHLLPMATFFQIEEGSDNYYKIIDAFGAVINGLGDGAVVKNGPWIFAQPNAVSKGTTLNHFLREFDLSPDTVLAVGDHENDISMLNGSCARHSGCPGTAVPQVKETVEAGGGYISEVPGPLGTLDVLCHYLS